jgi:hypothetical protein
MTIHQYHPSLSIRLVRLYSWLLVVSLHDIRTSRPDFTTRGTGNGVRVVPCARNQFDLDASEGNSDRSRNTELGGSLHCQRSAGFSHPVSLQDRTKDSVEQDLSLLRDRRPPDTANLSLPPVTSFTFLKIVAYRNMVGSPTLWKFFLMKQAVSKM